MVGSKIQMVIYVNYTMTKMAILDLVYGFQKMIHIFEMINLYDIHTRLIEQLQKHLFRMMILR